MPAKTCFLRRCVASSPPTGPYSSILDVGCGDGLFFNELFARFTPLVEGVEADSALGSRGNLGDIESMSKPLRESYKMSRENKYTAWC